MFHNKSNQGRKTRLWECLRIFRGTPKSKDMGVPALKDDNEFLINGSVPSLSVFEGNAWLEVSVDKTELGRPDSFRYIVLILVLDERYEQALEELKKFSETPSEYPNFHERIEKFLKHAADLVYAIKAKRSFPGILSLTRAKQQELREKFKMHFKELQYVLRIIEKIHTDLRVEDARSTIYVVRAVWYAVMGIVLVGFYMEFTHGLAQSSSLVFNDLFGDFADWAARVLNL